MSQSQQEICKRCIMDLTDPDIEFDENGFCNHCRQARSFIERNYCKSEEKKRRLQNTIESIRETGKNNRYDCIIGLSGGVDSSYVALLTKKYGLRPLAVHLDNSWDSELAVKNIENIVTKLDIDLYTHILDWEEFRELQLAFLKASVPDGEIPTDHAIVAILYQKAIEEGIQYIISGSNIATESILPPKWSAGHLDWRYINSVQKRFGNCKLTTFPHFNFGQFFLYYPYVKRIQTVRLLDLIEYNKAQVLNELSQELDWKSYGGKHCESIYTRFYQSYLLPTKFNFDKRKAHLSSLICSGQIDRQSALNKLQEPPCDPKAAAEDRLFVIKKFGIREEEFDEIMDLPLKYYGDYPSYKPLIHFLRIIYRKVSRWTGIKKRQAF